MRWMVRDLCTYEMKWKHLEGETVSLSNYQKLVVVGNAVTVLERRGGGEESEAKVSCAAGRLASSVVISSTFFDDRPLCAVTIN